MIEPGNSILGNGISPRNFYAFRSRNGGKYKFETWDGELSMDDVALERNFFRLPAAHLELIREGLRRKADATYRKLLAPAVPGWEPRVAAAGAR